MGILQSGLLILFLRASDSDLAQPLPIELMRGLKGLSPSSMRLVGQAWREGWPIRIGREVGRAAIARHVSNLLVARGRNDGHQDLLQLSSF